MVSFYDLTIGEQTEFHRVISKAGITDDIVRDIIDDSHLADAMWRAVTTTPVPSWYVSPQQQLRHVKALNRDQQWGMPNSAFPEVPEFTPATKTEVLLLAVTFPENDVLNSVERTIDEHLEVIGQQLRATGRTLKAKDAFDENFRIGLLDGIHQAPGVRWVAFDHAAHWCDGRNILAARYDGGQLPVASSEVLSALMLFPEWGPSMNARRGTPGVWAAGYLVASHFANFVFRVGWWEDQATLRVQFVIEPQDVEDSSFTAMPTVRELL